MDKQKTYTIGGHKFILKDLTMDEDEAASKIYGKISGENGQLTGDFTSADMRELLPIILEFEDQKKRQKPSFLEIKKTTIQKGLGGTSLKLITEIIVDFFVERLRSNANIKNTLIASAVKYSSNPSL
jgi:hypothetical protein